MSMFFDVGGGRYVWGATDLGSFLLAIGKFLGHEKDFFWLKFTLISLPMLSNQPSQGAGYVSRVLSGVGMEGAGSNGSQTLQMTFQKRVL